MADLIDRPASAVTPVSRAITPAPSAQVAVDKLLTTRSPQRPQRTPTFYVEIDGQKLEAFEGQTILEVCRANGIEVPTLCYDPKLPGFGACRSSMLKDAISRPSAVQQRQSRRRSLQRRPTAFVKFAAPTLN